MSRLCKILERLETMLKNLGINEPIVRRSQPKESEADFMIGKPTKNTNLKDPDKKKELKQRPSVQIRKSKRMPSALERAINKKKRTLKQ